MNAFYENDIAPKGQKAPAAKLPGLSYFFLFLSIFPFLSQYPIPYCTSALLCYHF